jgi:hypothetical protein
MIGDRKIEPLSAPMVGRIRQRCQVTVASSSDLRALYSTTIDNHEIDPADCSDIVVKVSRRPAFRAALKEWT